MSKNGNFTLPGESGYEKLTLELAQRWGADMIRDSDGTELSDEIVNAGYGIYSTICIIRDHNDWAKKNLDKLQQTFLVTDPVVSDCDTLEIDPMSFFFAEQFRLNEGAIRYLQVYDRTTNKPVHDWEYSDGIVTIKTQKWHKYTVSFLAYRVWEEISMYNHTTNNWEKEHLMQIDPAFPETREYLKNWLKNWCETHPKTTVVRFTSLFYNFTWIWGSDERLRTRFVDWASYDFSVSDCALDLFAEKYGYALTAEDFVNKGKYNVTHWTAKKQKRDWMEFTQKMVREFGRELVDIVHSYGKKAYVFYDDSWVGLEPYNGHFEEFQFDGLIKCVFSGYEIRLCAGVPVPTHEIRLHPYLFPIGLGGLPTFSEGGAPEKDAYKYWVQVRRALLQRQIERVGLGGYLHLCEQYPKFVEAMDEIVEQFNFIRELHNSAKPVMAKGKIAILTSWGKLRTWTLSGHFHETDVHSLIHVIESLSGLSYDVEFLDFDEVRGGVLDDFDVVINAGRKGDAWSGGDDWQDEKVAEKVTEFVAKGGILLGIGEPSATDGFDNQLRMAHVFGVDIDTGEYVNHGRMKYEVEPLDGINAPKNICPQKHLRVINLDTKIHAEMNGLPIFTSLKFGEGYGIYLSDYHFCVDNTNFLKLVLERFCGDSGTPICDNVNIECTAFSADDGTQKMVCINSSETEENGTCVYQGKSYPVSVAKCGIAVIEVG